MAIADVVVEGFIGNGVKWVITEGFGTGAAPPSPPPPPPPPPSGGGKRRSSGRVYYDKPRRIILPNGERVTVETQDEYFALMDDLIAGLVPEAVEEMPKPSAKQVQKAKKKVQQAALKLDIPQAVIEERVQADLSKRRQDTERKATVYPVTRITVRAKQAAPDQFEEIRFEMIAQAIREAFEAENQEDEAFMMMVAEMFL